MSTTTARVAITKPAPGDSMATGGTVLAANWVLIDGAACNPTFTSGTRPALPWTGRTIYESDTTFSVFYDGTKWSYWSGTGNAQNLVGVDPQIQSDNSSATAETEVLHKTVTFTAQQNRRYLIHFETYGHYAAAINSGGRAIVRWGTGGTAPSPGGGTLLRSTYSPINSSGACGYSISDYVELDYTGSTGTISVGLYITSTSSNVCAYDGLDNSIDVQGSICVRDYGVH